MPTFVISERGNGGIQIIYVLYSTVRFTSHITTNVSQSFVLNNSTPLLIPYSITESFHTVIIFGLYSEHHHDGEIGVKNAVVHRFHSNNVLKLQDFGRAILNMTPSHLIPRSFVVIRRSIPFLVDTAVERHDLFFQQQQRVVSHFFSSIGTQRFAKDWSHADIRSTTSSIHDRIIGNTSPGIRDFSSPQNTPPTVPVVLLQEDNKSKHQTDSELVTSNGNTKLSQIHKQTNNDRYWEHWMYQLQSPPNVITVARLLSTPLLSYWIITQQTVLAVSGCLLAAISDVADGYLARRANMSTTLGTYLDPLGTYYEFMHCRYVVGQ